MVKETMTREERVRAAVDLDVPDRVPVVPLMGQFALRYQDLPQTEAYRNPPRAL
ncbi:MAG: hypothetical protein H8E40_00965, partial [Chloroflexi bacterium]|nr:hypothetical protein [Chloroflexota bacterium]